STNLDKIRPHLVQGMVRKIIFYGVRTFVVYTILMFPRSQVMSRLAEADHELSTLDTVIS
ncbi:MAG: hypothetical protein WCE91_03325, partial [Nitrososphaeraceae archaeon]